MQGSLQLLSRNHIDRAGENATHTRGRMSTYRVGDAFAFAETLKDSQPTFQKDEERNDAQGEEV
jgi:hypothetical protein